MPATEAPQFERKSYALLELKSEGEGEFSGYASTYNKDLQGDQIQPGAFAQSIADKRGKIPIFQNHEDSEWIGFSKSLAEDGKGLALVGKLALKTDGGRNAYELLQAAAEMDYRVGMSIGFVAKDWDWEGDTRILKEIDLWEVSLTPFPAQPKAFVTGVKTLRDMEKHLREVERFSKSDARRILRVFADLNLSSGGRLDDATPELHRHNRVLRELVALSPWRE
jgi:uncharacterized protein